MTSSLCRLSRSINYFLLTSLFTALIINYGHRMFRGDLYVVFFDGGGLLGHLQRHCGDQNRYFKPKQDPLLNLTKWVFVHVCNCEYVTLISSLPVMARPSLFWTLAGLVFKFLWFAETYIVNIYYVVIGLDSTHSLKNSFTPPDNFYDCRFI